VIRLESVSKIYGSLHAVQDVSLEVGAGEFCCLLGPSGCGKSTLLKMINRMVEPTRGTVLFQGRDVMLVKPELLRRQIGYVIQSVGLFPHMTVLENIGVVPGLLGWSRSKTRKRGLELLELFGMAPDAYAGKYPDELSGGEAQRVGVARALSADPAVLLMDEPFGALDPLTRNRLQNEFARIQRELRKTIVFVTHDIDEAVHLASRIALMNQGRLVQYDTPETLLSSPGSAFVKRFIGTDRALKKLSRRSVQGLMQPARSIRTDSPPDQVREALRTQAETCAHPFLWVVSGQGVVQGWVDGPELSSTLGEAMNSVDPADFALKEDTTLKQALSQFLRHGVECLPVVDERFRLLGELNLKDLLSA
jgi:osmoprotectant transport system ATP-binding protein